MVNKKKPGQIKAPNPARAKWDADLANCETCTPEPANAKESKYWRQDVYNHGHGYPPAKNVWINPPVEAHTAVSYAQGPYHYGQ
jgi:hypothetical protein